MRYFLGTPPRPTSPAGSTPLHRAARRPFPRPCCRFWQVRVETSLEPSLLSLANSSNQVWIRMRSYLQPADIRPYTSITSPRALVS